MYGSDVHSISQASIYGRNTIVYLKNEKILLNTNEWTHDRFWKNTGENGRKIMLDPLFRRNNFIPFFACSQG